MKKNVYLVIASATFLLCGCELKTASTTTYLNSNEYTSVSEDEIHNKWDTENISDLVYYGEPAKRWENGDSIVIDLTTFDNFEHIDEVCIRNCMNDYEIYFPISQKIRYSVEETSSYYVYAISEDGTMVDLSDYIVVEHSYTNGTGNVEFVGL